MVSSGPCAPSVQQVCCQSHASNQKEELERKTSELSLWEETFLGTQAGEIKLLESGVMEMFADKNKKKVPSVMFF